jgi:hypothetical protein
MNLHPRNHCAQCGRVHRDAGSLCPRCIAQAARREIAKTEAEARLAAKKAQREEARREGAAPYRRWR